jgi:hypothetical protein
VHIPTNQQPSLYVGGECGEAGDRARAREGVCPPFSDFPSPPFAARVRGRGAASRGARPYLAGAQSRAPEMWARPTIQSPAHPV